MIASKVFDAISYCKYTFRNKKLNKTPYLLNNPAMNPVARATNTIEPEAKKTLRVKLKSLIKEVAQFFGAVLVYTSAGVIGIVISPITIPYFVYATCTMNPVYKLHEKKNKTVYSKMKSFLTKTVKAVYLIVFLPLYVFYPC